MDAQPPPQPRQPRHRNEFEVAIICALPVEADAVEAIFDGLWEQDHQSYGKAAGDPNAYTTGWINSYNVVLGYMPGIGKANAARATASFKSSFPNIKLALVVGICGGAPSDPEGYEILLGDTIISTGIVQFDFGRQFPDQLVPKDTLEGNNGHASDEIRSLLHKLKSHRSKHLLAQRALTYLATLQDQDFLKAKYPGSAMDKLYESTYRHKHQKPESCSTCTDCISLGDHACDLSRTLNCTIVGCSDYRLISRERSKTLVGKASQMLSELPPALRPTVHFGLIASGDLVMKSGVHRDQIVTKHDTVGFEMEGAGAWNVFPTIIVKAVCDYADSHKNKAWQNYAAASAAAFTKSLLWQWRSVDPQPVGSNVSASAMQTLGTGSIREKLKEFNVCLQSLHFQSMFSRQDMISDPASNTFDWIWEPRNNFANWLRSGQGVYWITGKPGSGKSTMMKSLLNSKDRMVSLIPPHRTGNNANPSEAPFVLSYFFYFGGDALSRSLEGMLRSFIFQLLKQEELLRKDGLLQQESSLYAHVQPDYAEMASSHSVLEWRAPVLSSLFTRVLKSLISTPVLVIVDALDEFAGDDSIIASFFDELSKTCSQFSSSIKFLLSSRPYPDFAYEFDDYMNLKMHQNTYDDIEEYIRQRFSHAKEDRRVELDQLTHEIVHRAKGVFLWVRLACDDLQRGWTRFEGYQQLLERLRKLPTELSDFYSRIFNDMDESDQETSLQILKIITCAARPLHVTELCDVLDYSNGRSKAKPLVDIPTTDEPSEQALCQLVNTFLVTQRLTLRKRIDAICRGLVHVTTDDVVELAHETVSAFLSRQDQHYSTLSRGTQLLGHEILLESCTRCLETFSISSDTNMETDANDSLTDALSIGLIKTVVNGSDPGLSLNDRIFATRDNYRNGFRVIKQGEPALTSYATYYCLYHARQAEKSASRSQAHLLKLISPSAFQYWQAFSRHFHHESEYTNLQKIWVSKSFFALALRNDLRLSCKAILENAVAYSEMGHPSGKHQSALESSDIMADLEEIYIATALNGDFEIAKLLLNARCDFQSLLERHEADQILGLRDSKSSEGAGVSKLDYQDNLTQEEVDWKMDGVGKDVKEFWRVVLGHSGQGTA